MSAVIHSLSDYTSDDDLVLVPQGEYILSYQHHTTWFFMGRFPKVVVTYRIFDMGEQNDKPILAYYNPKKIIGKPRKNGHFTAGWRSRFMWDYANCFGKPARQDRIPMCRFKDNLVVAKIRTVTHNRDQRKYPEGLEYSVVSELLGVYKP
jgi:hypothetical protein